MTGATVFGDFVNVFNMSSEPIRMTPDVASPAASTLDRNTNGCEVIQAT
ncbi:hypothetical protein [Xanthomonas oryzae]|nr:hypothetical protein [Xanthomonas oryzae]UQA41254.1 hypothetical protein KX727_08485 [Xanthomonas oryzae pv. oryzae]UQA44880.1 hypothetical protein KX725_08500 [Xanthomonas oryzae pv. oryzae]UQA48507.1 hypothetical protein KX726_08475 [Xanthomonas oryzae pv. oryzae]UXW34020.1 hypothetical protein IXO651_015660 [Xanthomonas oryzae pv. oryzae]WDM97027.1 hypothetical protein LL927_01630 [Xanthomonas oryzae]